jgi:hypothetical protein
MVGLCLPLACSFGEWCLLVSWCAGGRCGMVAQVGYSVAGLLRGRVVLCAVCTMHMKTRSAGFLVEHQNQGRWVVNGLSSKPLASKLVSTIFLVWPQSWWRRFLS